MGELNSEFGYVAHASETLAVPKSNHCVHANGSTLSRVSLVAPLVGSTTRNAYPPEGRVVLAPGTSGAGIDARARQENAVQVALSHPGGAGDDVTIVDIAVRVDWCCCCSSGASAGSGTTGRGWGCESMGVGCPMLLPLPSCVVLMETVDAVSAVKSHTIALFMVEKCLDTCVYWQGPT